MSLSRLQRLQAQLDSRGLDCAVAIAGPNLYYLTGLAFHLSERPTAGFFPARGEPVIVAGNLEESRIAGGAPYPLRHFTYADADGPEAAFGQAAAALGLPGKRLGVEARRMRVMELRLLEAAASGCRIDAADGLFARLRMTKDADEINAMRRAVAIAERALEAALPQIRVGATEREIAAQLVIALLRAGSDADLPFAPIVASGPNSALPHATITDRRLQPGDLLILDWGAASGGYFSDLTRTFAVGELSRELKQIHALALSANEAARRAAAPGALCADVDAAARRTIADGGYGEYFVHRVGHGLGLEGHEEPSVHGASQIALEPGVTFTVEPGIYLPGRGGVRIEDDVVVTADGCESLSSYPRELQVVG